MAFFIYFFGGVGTTKGEELQRALPCASVGLLSLLRPGNNYNSVVKKRKKRKKYKLPQVALLLAG